MRESEPSLGFEFFCPILFLYPATRGTFKPPSAGNNMERKGNSSLVGCRNATHTKITVNYLRITCKHKQYVCIILLQY